MTLIVASIRPCESMKSDTVTPGAAVWRVEETTTRISTTSTKTLPLTSMNTVGAALFILSHASRGRASKNH